MKSAPPESLRRRACYTNAEGARPQPPPERRATPPERLDPVEPRLLARAAPPEEPRLLEARAAPPPDELLEAPAAPLERAAPLLRVGAERAEEALDVADDPTRDVTPLDRR
jgi:hypothetical protein